MMPRPAVPHVPHDAWRQDRPDGSILLGSHLPLGPVARTSADWLHQWAAKAPDRVFVAERSGEGWRELRYGALLDQVRAVAAALAGRGLGAGTPVAMLSGAGVDHAVLTLAAQYAGIPVVPLAEQYSLVAAAHPRLLHAIRTVRPHLVFADRASSFAAALALDGLAGIQVVCSEVAGAPGPATPFAALLRGNSGVDLEQVRAKVGPDFSLLVAAMRDDPALRRAYFTELDLIFYAAAAVTPELWAALAALARAETGRVPLMFAAWGMSETAPAATQTHQPVDRPGNVGVPLPNVTLKLLPDAAGRCELRVKGPNVMPGYFEEPDRTRDAFDAEGFMLTGDAVRFIDPADPNAGLAFDGRVAEDFKLSTGTWVRATTLRLDVLGQVSAFATDVVLTGHDRDELGLLVFPDRRALEAGDIEAVDCGGVLSAPGLSALVRAALRRLSGPGAGSSTRIARALVLAEPPSMTAGELTAKGSINARQVLQNRAAFVQRLYDDADTAVIRPGDEDPA